MQVSREKYRQVLIKYIPNQTVEPILDWFYHYNFDLRITKSRNTKLGDFMNSINGERHKISINHDLNQYAFLITLVHELAHLVTYQKYKHQVKPHGNEWKFSFQVLLSNFLNETIFPNDILEALKNYINNPAASSCTDTALMRVLKKYDAIENANSFQLLENLLEGQFFKYGKKRFFLIKEIKRKRYWCEDIESKRLYSFSPLAEVELLNMDNII